MKEYFTKIILPFVDEKRRILKLSREQEASSLVSALGSVLLLSCEAG